MKTLLQSALAQAMDYRAYRDLIDALYADGRSTGHTQSEAYLNYSGLNIHRMNKWDKHFALSGQTRQLLRELDRPQTWLVITEGWCGDAAHSVPIMQKMAEATPAIDLKLVLRDEQEELMDHFLTKGARSIPKLIMLDRESLAVLGSWGSAPAELSQLKQDLKAAGEEKEAISKAVQLWYSRDRGKAIEREIAAELALQLVN